MAAFTGLKIRDSQTALEARREEMTLGRWSGSSWVESHSCLSCKIGYNDLIGSRGKIEKPAAQWGRSSDGAKQVGSNNGQRASKSEFSGR